MEGLYIAGEPNTNTEASIAIGIKLHPDFVTDEKSPGYDSELVEYFKTSLP